MGDRRTQYEQRRRDLQKRIPQHFCQTCSYLVYAEDEECFHCDSERPPRGWTHLQDSLDPWLGRILGERYLLVRRIGQGASASVYLAESMAFLRQFAIKVIHPNKEMGAGPEQMVTRLQREVDALGRLRNPHIVRFYDVLQLPQEYLAVVMDFVEGDTLEDLVLRDGVLSVLRSSTILRQVANGLYEAHLTGLIHRDLKPENIMIEHLPAGDDFSYILDFGIVRVEGETKMTHGFIGTPLYASPEQAMGREVDNRSDVYSLGAIFFFMLTGSPPFLGNNVMEVLRQHAEREPPSLSETTGKPFPRGVEELVARMLAKKPDERPQSLAEVITALDHRDFKMAQTPPPRTAISHSGSSAEWVRPPSQEGPSLAEASGSSKGEIPIELADEATSGHMPQVNKDSSSGSGIIRRQSRSNQSPPHHTPVGLRDSSESGEQSFLDSDTGNSSAVGESLEVHVASASKLVHALGDVTPPRGFKLETFVCTDDFRCLYLHQDTLHLHSVYPPSHKRLHVPATELAATALALDDKTILLGRDNGAIERIDVTTGDLASLFTSVFSDSVADVALGSHGELMLAAMDSGRIYMSGVGRDERDWVRINKGESVDRIVLSPRDDLFAISRSDGNIEIYRTSQPKHMRLSIRLDKPAGTMAFSEDGYLLAVNVGQERISLYQVINGSHLISFDIGQHMPLGFFFSPNNTLMGYVFDGERIFVQDLQQHQRAHATTPTRSES